MKVMHFATNDFGGAGLATLKIHKTMKKFGIESCILVKNKKSNLNDVFELEKKKIFDKILRKIRRIFIYNVHKVSTNYIFPYENNQRITHFSSNKIKKKFQFIPDAIIIHWVSGFINYRNIYELQKKTKAKIYIVMMDNESITGGCHYPWDCKNYYNKCLECVALEQNKSLAYHNLLIKKKYIELFNPILISCSSFDYHRAKNSYLYRNRKIEKNYIMVDKLIYYPKTKKNNSKTIKIFFNSISMHSKRKGFFYFQKVLEKLKESGYNKNILIMLVGREGKKIKLPYPVKYLNYAKTDEELSEILREADLYLSTSIEDSGPYMLNLALMSGLSIVSFRMGLAEDFIVHKKNGYIAKLYDIEDLANGIKYTVELIKKNKATIKEISRKMALEKCSEEVVMKKWKELLEIK